MAHSSSNAAAEERGKNDRILFRTKNWHKRNAATQRLVARTQFPQEASRDQYGTDSVDESPESRKRASAQKGPKPQSKDVLGCGQHQGARSVVLVTLERAQARLGALGLALGGPSAGPSGWGFAVLPGTVEM